MRALYPHPTSPALHTQAVAASAPAAERVQKAKREWEHLRVVEEEELAAAHVSKGALGGDARFEQVMCSSISIVRE